MVLHNITKARAMVLDLSLELEARANNYLSYILGIDNFKESASFGYRSSNMPFINKIHLLMDMNVIEPQEKDTVNNFMTIRNKFMHDLDCTTFEIALPLLKNINIKKQLLGKYKPVDNIKARIKAKAVQYDEPLDEEAYNREIPLEEQYAYCVEKMGKEAKDILEKAVDHHMQNLMNKMETKKNEQRMVMFAATLYEYDGIIAKKAEELAESGKSITGEELRLFTSDVMSNILSDIMDKEKVISDEAQKEFGFD